jgi:uncharacterized protein (DUF2336 family)
MPFPFPPAPPFHFVIEARKAKPSQLEETMPRISNETARRRQQLVALRGLYREFRDSGHQVTAEALVKLEAYVKAKRDRAAMADACASARKWRQQIEV